jgi:hypothetical protein
VICDPLETARRPHSTLNVDGHTISFKNASTPSAANVPSGSGVSGNVVTDGNGNSTVYLQSATVADVLKAVDLATGVRTASNSGGTASVTTASGQTNSAVNLSGVLQLSTGVNSDLSITATGNALSVLGLTGATGSASAGADAPVVTRAAQQAAPRSPLAAVIRSAHSRHQRSSVVGAHRSEHRAQGRRTPACSTPPATVAFAFTVFARTPKLTSL